MISPVDGVLLNYTFTEGIQLIFGEPSGQAEFGETAGFATPLNLSNIYRFGLVTQTGFSSPRYHHSS